MRRRKLRGEGEEGGRQRQRWRKRQSVLRKKHQLPVGYDFQTNSIPTTQHFCPSLNQQSSKVDNTHAKAIGKVCSGFIIFTIRPRIWS